MKLLDRLLEILSPVPPGAKRIVCGWCGKPTHSYHIDDAMANPENSLCRGTICRWCGRSVEEFYQNWIYRAEYSDGCHTIIWANGGEEYGGPKHAPHLAFCPNDIPVREWKKEGFNL